MQSIWIELLVIISACAVRNSAVPVDITEPSDVGQSRIIIPPELPTLHFEMLKERSEKDKKQNESDSTPLAFLRSEDDVANMSKIKTQLPTIAFEGNKQTPIYITIPIYFNSGYPGPTTVAVDKGAVVAGPMLEKVPEDDKDKTFVLSSNDLRDVFMDLMKKPRRQNNRRKNVRNKNRESELKIFKIYRD